MCSEPEQKEIEERQKETGESFYNARESLREEAYRASYGSEKPPHMDWGTFWKTF